MLDDPNAPASATLNRKMLLQGLGLVGGAVLLERCSGGGTTPTVAATATPTATATVSPTPAATVGVNATATPTATATASPTSVATAVSTPSTVVTASATPTAVAVAGTTCVVTDEGEIGPYFADDSASGFDRSNILANIDGTSVQSGVALTLNIYVVDTKNSCAAYIGAQVDIWHCNAVGVYSDISSENTSSQTYLRGYQLTNSAGYVQFTTIIPGWYSGRTNHIHVRVRSTYSQASSTSDGTNTTQLFFPQDVITYLSENVSPYSTEGTDNLSNASDRVYSEEVDGQTLLTLSGSYAAGFTATYTVGLPITQTYSMSNGPSSRSAFFGRR